MSEIQHVDLVWNSSKSTRACCAYPSSPPKGIPLLSWAPAIWMSIQLLGNCHLVAPWRWSKTPGKSDFGGSLKSNDTMIHLNDLWKGFLKSTFIHRNQKLEGSNQRGQTSAFTYSWPVALKEAPLRRLCANLFPSTLHSPWGGSSTSAARQWMLEVSFEWWNQWGLSLCCAGSWKLQPEIYPGSLRRWKFHGTYPS